MNKISVRYSWFVIIFITLCLTACFSEKQTLQVIQPQCISAQSVCYVELPTGRFDISFNQAKLTAETPFEIHIDYQGEYRLINLVGHIEGIDMFMGKIPLFFNLPQDSGNSEKQHVFTETMFGSCSLAKMKWRMFLTAEITLKGETKKQDFFIEFTSLKQ